MVFNKNIRKKANFVSTYFNKPIYMKSIIFIQYPKCTTCKKAYKWLKENNIEVTSRDITKDNPTEEELTAWIEESEYPINKFFNISGKIYKEQNLKDIVKNASKTELISILASNGMLVKRPVLVGPNFVLVGFNEEEWAKKLL